MIVIFETPSVNQICSESIKSLKSNFIENKEKSEIINLLSCESVKTLKSIDLDKKIEAFILNPKKQSYSSLSNDLDIPNK